jgi:hypothetical protein
MNHRKIVEELVNMHCCSNKDLADLVLHDLAHMGIIDNDYQECVKQLYLIIKESI